MNGNPRKAQKTATLVEVSLTDGSVVFANIFVAPQSRLIDTLNDERSFLPMESIDGAFLALAKAAIKQISLPASKTEPYRGSNPYTILGVKEGISTEDLKAAYYQLSLANHPDRINGLGLGDDYLELATQNMARINIAYTQILKQIGN